MIHRLLPIIILASSMASASTPAELRSRLLTVHEKSLLRPQAADANTNQLFVEYVNVLRESAKDPILTKHALKMLDRVTDFAPRAESEFVVLDMVDVTAERTSRTVNVLPAANRARTAGVVELLGGEKDVTLPPGTIWSGAVAMTGGLFDLVIGVAESRIYPVILRAVEPSEMPSEPVIRLIAPRRIGITMRPAAQDKSLVFELTIVDTATLKPVFSYRYASLRDIAREQVVDLTKVPESNQSKLLLYASANRSSSYAGVTVHSSLRRVMPLPR